MSSCNKGVAHNQICISRYFENKYFSRRPKNVKVWKWLWDGAGGGLRPLEVPSHNHFHTSTFFGRREKKKIGRLQTANQSHFSPRNVSSTTYQKMSPLTLTVVEIWPSKVGHQIFKNDTLVRRNWS